MGYSLTSEQRTLWDQYNYAALSFVLVSEVQNELDTNYWDLKECPLLRGLLYCISECPLSEVLLYHRLFPLDMAIYGREPATDNLVLVVCDICNRTVKSQAFMRHKGA